MLAQKPEGRAEEGPRLKYKEIKLFAKDSAQLALLTEELTAAGFDELLINDPKDVDELQAGSWAYTGSVADKELLDSFRSSAYAVVYLGADEQLSPALSELTRRYECSQAVVDDEDWLHKWEEYYVPFHITPDIVVKPVWREYEKQPGELVIEIDPGLAFGTGTSPTTYLAARLLEKYIKPGMDIIDAGCGTGILSVIAAKLGARSVLGLDIDPEAVAATENNAGINGCGNIDAAVADLLKGVQQRADLVIGNLLAPLVMALSEQVAQRSGPGTLFVASGIIDDMEEECLAHVKAQGFRFLEIMRDDCWTAFAAEYTGRSA
jgi:ribosomal protein L11 methyltransferase